MLISWSLEPPPADPTIHLSHHQLMVPSKRISSKPPFFEELSSVVEELSYVVEKLSLVVEELSLVVEDLFWVVEDLS